MASLEKFIEEISAETLKELYIRRRQQHVYSQEKQKALDREIEYKRDMAAAEEREQDRKFQIQLSNAKETARVKGQKFQAAQAEREKATMADTKVVDPKNVMVVYGRDEKMRTSMFEFLRSLGLNPIEWEQAVRATGSASPHTLDVVVNSPLTKSALDTSGLV